MSLTPVQPQKSVGITGSPYLTLEEGARFYRFDDCLEPVIAFRKWLHRQHVPVVKRGRKLLVERQMVDAALERLNGAV